MSRGTEESGGEFLRRLEAGDKSALERVYRDFADRLLQLAERQIGDQLRPFYAPEDAAMSALGSFCRRTAEGAYRFDHAGAVWRLLQTITVHKICREATRHRREIRAKTGNDVSDLASREPSHEEVIEYAEAIQAFLSRFTPRDAEILQLWLEGLSSVEIAQRVGWSRWTVDRVTKATRDWIDTYLGS